jgi:hypothetical protein
VPDDDHQRAVHPAAVPAEPDRTDPLPSPLSGHRVDDGGVPALPPRSGDRRGHLGVPAVSADGLPTRAVLHGRDRLLYGERDQSSDQHRLLRVEAGGWHVGAGQLLPAGVWFIDDLLCRPAGGGRNHLLPTEAGLGALAGDHRLLPRRDVSGVLRPGDRVLRDVDQPDDPLLHQGTGDERRSLDRPRCRAVLPDRGHLPASTTAPVSARAVYVCVLRGEQLGHGHGGRDHGERQRGRRRSVLPSERDVRPAPLCRRGSDDVRSVRPDQADRLPVVSRPGPRRTRRPGPA